MTNERRPTSCRNRQRDEEQMYPKSGCEHCGTGGLTGCPYESAPRASGTSASLDDAFTSDSLAGRMTASSVRIRALIEERDCALRLVELMQRRFARTTEGRVIALLADMGS